jgi:hypothetical protein
MKKNPPISRLWRKAGEALQRYYRSKGGLCMSCGRPMSVIHHHIPQARAKHLRFDERNLVRLCAGCHLKHHCGDPSISFRYRNEMRNIYKQQWEDDLIVDSHKLVKKSIPEIRQELETIIKKYEQTND